MAKPSPTAADAPAPAPPAVTPPSAENNDQIEFKEGGYGWIVVLAVHLLNAHTWGLNSSFSVFLAYYLRSGFFAGASPIAFAFVGGLSVAIALLVSPVATICVRLYGTRATLLIGTVVETTAFIGASFTSEMWQLILAQGLAFGFGIGFLFVASVGVVPQWFVKNRSLANGLAAGGSGIGGLIYALATNAMIPKLGLPWAFRILGIIVFVVNCVCSVLVRDRNQQVGAKQDAWDRALFRKPEYYLLLGWAFFSLLSYIIVVFSLPDYCQTVGFSATEGAIVAAMYNLSQGVGRPIIGLASDRFGRINVAGLGTLIAGAASFILWTLAGRFLGGVIVYALFGAFSGILWGTIGPVCAEVIGLQLLPSGLSVVWLTLVLPATFSMAIGVSLRGPGVDGYLKVQMFVGSMYMIAFACAWVLRGWKLWEMENMHLSKTQRDEAIRNDDRAATPTELAEETGPVEAGAEQTLVSYLLKGRWILSRERV